MTPIGSSVLQSAPPDGQCGVAVGHQGWVKGEALVQTVAGGAAVEQQVLSEPADGLVAAGPEAAGQHAVLRHAAHHRHL